MTADHMGERHVIPDDHLIEVGNWYVWARPGAWEPCKVTAKSDGEEETHIQSVNQRGKACWNEETWFRKACILPTESQTALFEECFQKKRRGVPK